MGVGFASLSGTEVRLGDVVPLVRTHRRIMRRGF